ncbi:hypothetical protein A3E76_02515 [Candidatus Saccharibacteria bacterium RIFCSPHIGHO2_12_FULL_44_22]|nr:MAG: hypothetical protein A3E76_02515 [Candidatus Saccharibacteria bacterium RIFCSPHIGHO2_12_FULL_44_22]
MTKNSQGQTGSVYIIIIVLILAIVGCLGFLFWKNYINISQTPMVSTEQQAVSPAPKDRSDESSKEDGYFDIKEWGVKLKMSTKEDLTYNISSRTGLRENTEYDALGLRIKTSSVISQSCVEFGTDLYRQKIPTEFNSKKIGEYYYYVTGAPGPCSEDAADLELQKKVLSELEVSNVLES